MDLLEKKVLETASLNVALITKMHDALTQIVTTEHGLDGGITAREIARDALVDCQSMTDQTLPPIRPIKMEIINEEPQVTPSAGAAFSPDHWECSCPYPIRNVHIRSTPFCPGCRSYASECPDALKSDVANTNKICPCIFLPLAADKNTLTEENAHAKAAA